MTYARFKAVLKTVCARAAHNAVLRFEEDTESKKFRAFYGDIEFVGNGSSDSITVNVPNHTYMWKVGCSK